jgi:hypothetical protein
MQESLGDLMTMELAVYWALDDKRRESTPRKQHLSNLHVAAVALFIRAGQTPQERITRTEYVDDAGDGLTRIYDQFH